MLTYIGEANCGTNMSGQRTWAFLARDGSGRVGVYEVDAAGIEDQRALVRALRDDPGVARVVAELPSVPVLRAGAAR